MSQFGRELHLAREGERNKESEADTDHMHTINVMTTIRNREKKYFKTKVYSGKMKNNLSVWSYKLVYVEKFLVCAEVSDLMLHYKS